MSKSKTIGIRIDEETYKALKQANVDISEYIRSVLANTFKSKICPVCNQPIGGKHGYHR